MSNDSFYLEFRGMLNFLTEDTENSILTAIYTNALTIRASVNVDICRKIANFIANPVVNACLYGYCYVKLPNEVLFGSIESYYEQ